jgi:ELWxxDGT repeat protein
MKKQLLTCIALIMAITINAQVTLVKEINDNGTSSSSPNNLFIFNGKIYFGADDSNGSNTPGGVDLGREIWETDGTEVGTTFLKDLRTGSDSSSPGNFFEFGGTLYFSANSGAGNVLFSSDGTDVNTVATGGDFVFNPLEFGGLIYYVNTVDSNTLYTFDGTTQAKVANVGAEDVEFLGGQFTTLNNKVIGYGRTAIDDPIIGIELYEYDLALDTYSLIKDITGDDANAGISNFTTIGNEVFFEATGGLWKTDGTEVGTIAVAAATAATGVANLFAWDGNLYFEGDAGTGDQLWKYDPVGNGLTNLSALAGDADHNPSDYAISNGFLYYSGADAGDTDKHLFRTNGATIEQLDSSIKDVDEIVVLNNILYFEGDNGTTGNELYTFDPATLSTDDLRTEIIKVYPNPTSDYIMVSKELLNLDYRIHDITGKTVKQGVITSEKIDLDLNSGLYLFKVETEVSTITKKIIVK